MLIVFGAIFGAVSILAMLKGAVIPSILYLLIAALFYCTDRIVAAIENSKS